MDGAPLPLPYQALVLLCAVLVTIRHRDNLRRLWRGEEKRA